ncbi:MAG: ABC transporter substrate-binding protein [Gammaproteobacteria bacterium]|nr:ABC transporter substrate-binding protein [Gammaproteobacteria bacterium]
MKKLLFVFLICFTTSVFAEDKLVVLLDWFANPDHAPLFVAQEQGFFKQQNLDVKLIGPADSADPPKLVAAGKADIAITYQPRFLEQVERGLPLIMIGTLINQPLNCLVVLRNHSINSLRDLKGKKIGYSGGSLNNITLKIMLEKQGIKVDELQLINIHYDLTQALLSEKVDAVTGMMRNFELTQMELNGHPGLAFYPEENGMPNYSELIFVTQKNLAHDARLPRFLKALKLAVTYLKKHPEDSWKTFAKNHPALNDELNHRAWNNTLPYFSIVPATIQEKSFMHFADFMQKNGLIKTVKPFSEYVALQS